MASAGGAHRADRRGRAHAKGTHRAPTRGVAGINGAASRWSAVALLSGALSLGGGMAMANPSGGESGYVDPANPGNQTTPTNPGDGQGGWVDPVAPVQPVEPTQPVEPEPAPPAGGTTFSPVWIDPAVVPAPPENDDLPLEVDARGDFAQQISCDPLDRPGVTAFALLVSDHYGRPNFSGARPCISYASFHHDGRALDWPLAAWDTNDRMVADSVILWLTDNNGEMAKRFGIEYLIWNYQIWYADGRGWSYYDGHPHDDHIHFSFTWDGAQMRTSWWTGVAVTQPDLGPCAPSATTFASIHLWPRFASCESLNLSSVIPDPVAAVAALTSQGLTNSGFAEGSGMEQLASSDHAAELRAESDEEPTVEGGHPDDLQADGDGAQDAGASVAQAPHRWQLTEFTTLRRTTLTQGDEGEGVKVLQEALGVEADGAFGPLTAEALTEWEATIPELALQAERRGEGPATVTPLTWTYLERAAHPTIVVRDQELAIGDVDQVADPDGTAATSALLAGETSIPYAGGAVSFLQDLLGVDADGSFGPMTEGAVREVQEQADLEPTGVVDGATWVAVETAALAEGRAEGAPGSATAREARLEAEKKAEEAKAKKAAEKKAAEKKAAERAARQHEAAISDAE
ncbi:peptidoglycan-binding domain-containing protein [Ornithinimicrobium panacihumi]|uniref:peptidoglycan-binding domain-containing protein n=1 Tax=Ornithinimicrobium panacihumi TaxID=2008449 RepID=UPI003F88B197